MGPNDTNKDNAKKASADADDDLDRKDSPQRKKKEQTTNTNEIELSDEDLQLKTNLELLVQRVSDSKSGVAKMALEQMRTEIKTATRYLLFSDLIIFFFKGTAVHSMSRDWWRESKAGICFDARALVLSHQSLSFLHTTVLYHQKCNEFETMFVRSTDNNDHLLVVVVY